jgi:hypothetical protein
MTRGVLFLLLRGNRRPPKRHPKKPFPIPLTPVRRCVSGGLEPKVWKAFEAQPSSLSSTGLFDSFVDQPPIDREPSPVSEEHADLRHDTSAPLSSRGSDLDCKPTCIMNQYVTLFILNFWSKITRSKMAIHPKRPISKKVRDRKSAFAERTTVFHP